MKPLHISCIQGDITAIAVDAIVNAANTSLLGGGGVDGAIHRKGGPEILAQCRAIRARQGGCKVGEAVITGGGLLPAKYVIHTVGPVWVGGHNGEQGLLENAYRNCLSIAQENGLRSIAFPGISTGIYKFPKELAATIAIATARDFLQQPTSIEQVLFVCYDAENLAVHERLLGPEMEY